MTARKRIRVSCDFPLCAVEVEGPYGQEPIVLRAHLEREGWKVAPEYHSNPDFCPTHAKTKTT